MSKVTQDISNSIAEAKSIDELKKLQVETQVLLDDNDALDYIIATAEKHGFDKRNFIKEVVQTSNLERSFVYHIFSGMKALTRDKIIIFSIVGKFSIDELDAALKYAGFATLYSRNQRDFVIMYIIRKKMSLYEANSCLLDFKLEELK